MKSFNPTSLLRGRCNCLFKDFETGSGRLSNWSDVTGLGSGIVKT